MSSESLVALLLPFSSSNQYTAETGKVKSCPRPTPDAMVNHVDHSCTTVHRKSYLMRNEIRKAIRKLKNNKARGSDNIQAEMVNNKKK
jgi:hypothetical protein